MALACGTSTKAAVSHWPSHLLWYQVHGTASGRWVGSSQQAGSPGGGMKGEELLEVPKAELLPWGEGSCPQDFPTRFPISLSTGTPASVTSLNARGAHCKAGFTGLSASATVSFVSREAGKLRVALVIWDEANPIQGRSHGSGIRQLPALPTRPNSLCLQRLNSQPPRHWVLGVQVLAKGLHF